MNKRRRLWIAVILGIIAIVMILSVIAYVLYDFSVLEFGYRRGFHSGIQPTATYILTQNPIVETLISQTATAQAPSGTLTPTPTS